MVPDHLRRRASEGWLLKELVAIVALKELFSARLKPGPAT